MTVELRVCNNQVSATERLFLPLQYIVVAVFEVRVRGSRVFANLLSTLVSGFVNVHWFT